MYGRRHGLKAVVVCLALLLCGTAVAAASAGWSGIGRGSRGGYSWSVRANEGPGAPCLEVAIVHRHGRFSYDRTRFRGCAARSDLGKHPLIVGGRELGRGSDGETVIALVLPPGAERIRLDFARGETRFVASRRLPRRGARYAIYASRSPDCLTAVTGTRGAKLSSASGSCLPGI